MENKCKSEIKPYKQHPYLKIYEQSQTEALDSLSKNNGLNLDQIGVYADIGEPEEW